MIKNNVVVQEQLQRTVDVPYSEFDTVFTKTSVFMLVALGLKRNQLHSSFQNAFIRDQYRTHLYQYPIFLLFRLSVEELASSEWYHYQRALLEHQNYVHWYSAGRDGKKALLVFVFEVPSAYQSDYTKFLEGKYSEFSDEYKKLFFPFIVVKKDKVPNVAYQVIMKDPALKENLEELIDSTIDESSELWSPPDLVSRETLRWPEAEITHLLDH